MSTPIRLFVSDLDGTLVTPEKTLAPSTVAAAERLREAGVLLALVSARPPLGMRWIAEALNLSTPLAGFNGGTVLGADGSVLSEMLVPEAAAAQAVQAFDRNGIDAWLFTGPEWLTRSSDGDYVPLERRTVRFNERVVPSFDPYLAKVGKLVGATKDFDLLAQVEAELHVLLGDTATAQRSQRYYLDITHPQANKGNAVRTLARLLGIDLAQVAVIGDMANDVPMFGVAGLAIAMGNATEAVQAQARFVTTSNTQDGFANAVDRFVLPSAEASV